MNTRQLLLMALLLGAMPLHLAAQDDDLYFVPTKANVEKDAARYGLPAKTYYTGSQRTVDDYNRRAWSEAVPVDSAGNDIIDFSAVQGVYPDSAYAATADDYLLTRRMSRFDDYVPSDNFWAGYAAGRASSWYGWADPWYWNDPWYYSSYYGWYSPWAYRGWYDPWYYGYGWYGHYGWYGGPHYGGWHGGWHGGLGPQRPAGTSRPLHQTRQTNARRFGEATGTNRTFGGNSRTMGNQRSSAPQNTGSGTSFGSSRSGGTSSGGGRSGGSGGRSFGGRR